MNTTLIHPHFLHIVTSGIEKRIVLHSPTSSSPCTQNLFRTPTDVRRLSDDDEEDRNVYFRALAGFHIDALGDEAEVSERTIISMFDQYVTVLRPFVTFRVSFHISLVYNSILREEGEADVFTVRRWAPRSDSSDEGDEQQPNSDDSDILA